MSERLAYLILGSRGAGRRDVLADLIDFGIDADTTVQAFVSQDDQAAWQDSPKLFHSQAAIESYDWQGLDEGLAIEATADIVFVVTDGLTDPADSVEAFFNWLRASDYDLARVATVVDCARVQEIKPLLQWYDCCIHFSDVVLLGNRADVSNKWVEEFKERYTKECYPCHFVFVKKGRVSNPNLVLEPEVRRISKLFDENELMDLELDDDVEFGGDELDDEDEEEEEEFEGGDPSKDPFLARIVNGQREKTIPNIARLIG